MCDLSDNSDTIHRVTNAKRADKCDEFGEKIYDSETQKIEPMNLPTNSYDQQFAVKYSFNPEEVNKMSQKYAPKTDMYQVLHPRTRRKSEEASMFVDNKQRILLQLRYDNGYAEVKNLILNETGPLQVTVIYIAERHEIYRISFGSGIDVYGFVKEFKRNSLYDLFLRSGIVFNSELSERTIVQVLFKYFAPMIEYPSSTIQMSGKAGWQNGLFKSAYDMGQLRRYRGKMDVPVLRKYFDKGAGAGINVQDYIRFLSCIRDEKNRVLISLLPFAGVMSSYLNENKKNLLPVVNFIFMEPDIPIHSLTTYLQVFNRNEGFSTCSLEATKSEILSAYTDSKDEVLIFTGMSEEGKTYYANNVMTKNIKMMTQLGLGRYGNRTLQSLLVLFTNQMLMIKDTMNVYVDGFFFKEDPNDELLYHSLDAVLSLFVRYVENNHSDVKLRLNEKHSYTERTEHFWKVVLSLVKAFWSSLLVPFNEVLNLPDDFSYDFLWQSEEYDLENGSEVVIKAVRKAMSKIQVYHFEDVTELKDVMYDSEYIWILPDKFKYILDMSAVKASKDALLFKCKEDGLLEISPYGGFTTRTQKNGLRKDYYKFIRNSFNTPGLTEIIALAGGKKNVD